MERLQLYMILLGCKPAGRYTEQHDIFFGIGYSLKNLVPDIIKSWPEAPTIHIDAWRVVTEVNGNSIEVILKDDTQKYFTENGKLFFLIWAVIKKKNLKSIIIKCW